MKTKLFLIAVILVSSVSRIDAQSIDLTSDKVQTQLYTIANSDREDNFFVETRVRVHLPGTEWEGRPGKGLDFLLTSDPIDRQDAMTGRFGYFERILGDAEPQKYQIDEIRQLRSELRKKVTAVAQELMSNGASEESKEKLVEEFKTLKREMEEKCKSVLLPHQHEVLAQNRARRGWNSSQINFLTSEKLNKLLGLSEEQIESLKEADQASKDELAELEKRHKAELEEFVQKAKSKLGAILDDEQREKLTKLLGEEFDN